MSLEELHARVAFCQSYAPHELPFAQAALGAEEIRAKYFSPISFDDLVKQFTSFASNHYDVDLAKKDSALSSSRNYYAPPGGQVGKNKRSILSNLLLHFGIENDYSTNFSHKDRNRTSYQFYESGGLGDFKEVREPDQDIHIVKLTIPTNQDFFYGRARLMMSTITGPNKYYSEPSIQHNASVKDALDAATMSWGLPKQDIAIIYVSKLSELKAGHQFKHGPN